MHLRPLRQSAPWVHAPQSAQPASPQGAHRCPWPAAGTTRSCRLCSGCCSLCSTRTAASYTAAVAAREGSLAPRILPPCRDPRWPGSGASDWRHRWSKQGRADPPLCNSCCCRYYIPGRTRCRFCPCRRSCTTWCLDTARVWQQARAGAGVDRGGRQVAAVAVLPSGPPEQLARRIPCIAPPPFFSFVTLVAPAGSA